MISIYGYKDGNYVLLDAPQTSVELSFQIADLRRPAVKTAPFSLTFEMPFSATNNDFFGHQQEPSLQTTTFDLNRKTSARLHEDNVPLVEGIIQVTSIDVSAMAYKCRFFSPTADLFDAIKGKSWADVWRTEQGDVLCPLDHALTPTNVYNTWVGGTPPNPLLPTYTIIYALTDAGAVSYGASSAMAAYYFGFWANGIPIPTLRPCVRISYLLDEILAKAGFGRDTAECFFSDTQYNSTNLYMMCGLESQTLPTRLAYGFHIQNLPSQAQMSLGTANSYGDNEIIYWDVPPSGNFYDPDGQTNIIGWSPNVDQTATFEFRILLSNYSGGAGDPLPNMQISVGSSTTTFEYEDAVDAPFVWSPTIQVTAGENVIVILKGTGAGNVNPGGTLDYYITWSLVQYDVVSGDDNTTVQMTEALGSMTQDKFIQGLCDTYNLVLNVDDDRKMVSFQLYDEWLQSGGAPIDWTEKIDMNGPMEILPASDYVPRQMFLTPAEGKDHRNAYYEKHFGVRKGAFRFESRNDFALDDQTVGDVFSLLRNTYLKGGWFTDGSVNTNLPVTTVIISELWSSFNGDRTSYESTPNALCYYHGLQDTSDYPMGVGEAVVTSAPLFTAYSGSGTDSNVFSLEYSLSAPDLVVNDIIGTAVNGLYDKFWYNYLQSLFSRDARVLRCQARLTSEDIRNLDFSRYVNVRNVQYRIMSVQNYNVGSSGLCNLTLFKRADGFLYDCGLTPTVQTDGRVVWQDAGGNVVPGTQLCCSSYGYTWNAGNSTCSIAVNRTSSIGSGDVEDDSGGVVNRSSGDSISNTGTIERVFSSELQSPVTKETWDMFANTRGTPVLAQSLINQRQYELSPQRIVTLSVEWMAVETVGSNRGQSASGKEEALLSTVDSSTSKTTGSIYSRGLSSYSVAINVTDGVGGSFFEIECTPPSSTEADWFLKVSTVMYNTNKIKPDFPFLLALFQDNDQILFQDNDIMEFNDV